MRGVAAPLAGALLGGVLGVSSVSADRLLAFVRASWSGTARLADVPALLGAMTLPISIGALAGALLVGLLQTRGYVGWASAKIERLERCAPAMVFALVAWALVLFVLLDVARLLLSLHAGADPLTIGLAARVALVRGARGVVLIVVALALADHLWRARARATRLALDEASAPRAVPMPAVPDPEWLIATRVVLFEGDRAVAVDASGVIVARAAGLAALAMREAARAAGKRVRAQSLDDSLGVGETIPPSSAKETR